MSKKEIRIFGFYDRTLEQRARTIGNNIILIREALDVGETEKDPKWKLVGMLSKQTQRLIDTKKCLLWLVQTPEVDYAATTAYVFPDPEQNRFIPAIVVNLQFYSLAKPIMEWHPDNRIQVITAITNLPGAYGMAYSSQKAQLLTAEEFFVILQKGDPARQKIVPFTPPVSLMRNLESN